MAHGEQLAALRSDMNRVDINVQSMNTLLQSIHSHVELQSKLYQEFTKRSLAAPDPDESNT